MPAKIERQIEQLFEMILRLGHVLRELSNPFCFFAHIRRTYSRVPL
jgi:hypothetical protein